MKKHILFFIFAFACLVAFTLIVKSKNKNIQSCPVNLVNLPESPSRIVSLAPNITEILFALGLEKKIIAVSNDCDYPPEAREKLKTGSFWQPNIETIFSTKPDLVITEQIEQQKAVAQSLSKFGYKVLSLKIEKISDLLDAIIEIGKTTNCIEKANELSAGLSRQMKELQQKYSSKNKVKILWVVQLEPIRVVGRNTFINDLIEMAGGENAIGLTVQYYPPISAEEIMACGAEVIINSAMDAGDLQQQKKTVEDFWSKFAHLPAVKNKRIHVIKADNVLRLGPRLPQGIETIAHYLHPEQEK